MFKPTTIRIFSVVAMVLSVVGLSLSLFLAKMQSFMFILSIISWAILLWASYLGFRLSSYKLYEDEYKKVGIRIYLIIVTFFLFLFVGLVLGLLLSVVLLSTLWGLKKNYDEWEGSGVEEVKEETSGNL